MNDNDLRNTAFVTFLQELDRAFRDAPVEEAARPLATEQTRYVLANIALAKFLRKVGERDKADKFYQFAEALQDRVDGIRHPMFEIERPKGRVGRDRDTSAVWRVRASLCIGLEFMIAGGMDPEAAIALIVKQHHRKLAKLTRPGADLKRSIQTWRKSFANDAVSNNTALSIYKDGVKNLNFALSKHSGDDVRTAGERLVMLAAERSARLPRI
jgi:hypothetical protein